MEPQQPQLHYHIRRFGKALDWERFGSRSEAEASAKQLVRRDETYIIEAHGQLCRRCQAAMKLKQAHA